jgi:hypothetical protein
MVVVKKINTSLFHHIEEFITHKSSILTVLSGATSQQQIKYSPAPTLAGHETICCFFPFVEKKPQQMPKHHFFEDSWKPARAMKEKF